MFGKNINFCSTHKQKKGPIISRIVFWKFSGNCKKNIVKKQNGLMLTCGVFHKNVCSLALALRTPLFPGTYMQTLVLPPTPTYFA